MTIASSFNDIGSTSRAKYLTTYATMVLATPSGEYTLAIIALFGTLIVHPIIA